jgi:trehalose 6-phosphate phosphatase
MTRRRSLRSRLAGIPARRLLLFLDFDGTLAPIALRPDRATLPAPVRAVLRRLVRLMPVVIVSGRALGDLQRRVNVPGIRYIASHGLAFKELRAPTRWLGRRVPRLEVVRWRQALQASAAGIPGALVEDKGWSVALHDRNVHHGDRTILRRRVLRVLKPWLTNGGAALVRGKRVLEIRPGGSWNKGTAVAAVLTRPWARNRIPVYLGDDRTDRDAFRAVRGLGLAVRVGGRRGIWDEDAWLADPAAVVSVLLWLTTRREATW